MRGDVAHVLLCFARYTEAEMRRPLRYVDSNVGTRQASTNSDPILQSRTRLTTLPMSAFLPDAEAALARHKKRRRVANHNFRSGNRQPPIPVVSLPVLFSTPKIESPTVNTRIPEVGGGILGWHRR